MKRFLLIILAVLLALALLWFGVGKPLFHELLDSMTGPIPTFPIQ